MVFLLLVATAVLGGASAWLGIPFDLLRLGLYGASLVLASGSEFFHFSFPLRCLGSG